MSPKDVFESIGLIDDDLIVEAADSVKRVHRIKIRKIAVLAAAMVMLLGMTVWAANIILGGRAGHSYNVPSYDSIPSKDTMRKDTGIAPDIPERFSSGFVFDSGYITYNEDFDKAGTTVQEYNGLQFHYRKEQSEVCLFIDAAIAGIQTNGMERTERYGGSDLFYYSYINKIVPPDYRPTAEDKRAEQNGDIVISYGANEITLTRVQGVKWAYQGLNYELIAMNVDISEDTLMQMAKETLDIQK